MYQKKDTKKALQWIVRLLHKNRIPFHVTGGFAARIYGSKRRLRDIDIEIPSSGMKKILKDIKSYVIYGPAHYKDRHFDVPLITVEYAGQKIDLSASDKLKLFDSRTHKWVRYPIHLSAAILKKVMGIWLPVAPAEQLLSYKSMMNEKVQLEDIAAIEQALT